MGDNMHAGGFPEPHGHQLTLPGFRTVLGHPVNMHLLQGERKKLNILQCQKRVLWLLQKKS